MTERDRVDKKKWSGVESTYTDQTGIGAEVCRMER
jgi:hypothetical protein